MNSEDNERLEDEEFSDGNEFQSDGSEYIDDGNSAIGYSPNFNNAGFGNKLSRGPHFKRSNDDLKDDIEKNKRKNSHNKNNSNSNGNNDKKNDNDYIGKKNNNKNNNKLGESDNNIASHAGGRGGLFSSYRNKSSESKGKGKIKKSLTSVFRLRIIMFVVIAFFVLFLFLIVFVGASYIVIDVIRKNNKDSDFGNLVSSNGSCSYFVNGQTVSDLKVRLLECGGRTPIAGEELVDFEKYITGVTYAENGAGDYEALKVQAILARSFALTRPASMGNAVGLSLKEEDGQWILSIRNCTNDQVYCNPDKGCWSSSASAGATVHSGYDGTKAMKRKPLDENSNVKKAVEETKGQVVLDKSGNIVGLSYVASHQRLWNSLAKSGKDAFQIIVADYGSNYNLSNANCTVNSSIDSNVSGDVASIIKWDQASAWQNMIGISSSEKAPYVSQNTMNSRVTTIEVPMRKWVGSGSNPQTDTTKVMQKITINKALAPLWMAFFEDVYNNAPDFVIGSFEGCYVYRNSTSGGSLSAHAYGAACDINASTIGNGYGQKSYTEDEWSKLPNTRTKYQIVYRGSKVVQIAHKYTLINGSDWGNGGNDAMHFSFIRDWTRDSAIACQGKTSC